jgi:hypothetical protein
MLLVIANRRPVFGAARGRLAVDERRRDSAEATSQCPSICAGAPHLDYGVGGVPFG